MNSPYFSEEHQVFREAVRQFLEKEVMPHADQWEKEERIPRDIWHRMAEHDFLGIPYPEEYGGSNADFFFSVVFLEELARSTPGGFVAAVGVHEYIALAYIHHFGSQYLKEHYLSTGIRGEKIGALAVTEPNTGSDVAAVRTRARREGDVYVLNGAKTFITNGVYGDFIVVAAKTDPDAGTAGLSLLVVDSRMPGVTSRKLKKMGWHCSDTAEITFDDVQVPDSHLLGKENMGFYYLMEMFQLERLVAAIGAVAGSQHCIELTLNYISKREAFGKPLSRFQVIRHTLSDLSTEVEAARQLTYHACWLYQQRIPAIKQCTMAKLYATELAKKVSDACLQFFGGYGYMEEYLISRMYRDARVGTIVGGASEVMREIISKLMIDQVEYHSQQKGVEEKKKVSVAASSHPAAGQTEIPREGNGVKGKEEPGEQPFSPEPEETPDKKNELPDVNFDELLDASIQLPPDITETESSNEHEDVSPAEEVAPAGDSSDEEAASSFTGDEAVSGEDTPDDSEPPSAEEDGSGLSVASIIQTLPARFRAAKAGDYQVTVHFKISGSEGGEFTVRIDSHTCEVQQGCVGNADCVIETSDRTYIDMETGKLNPQIAFMMGKVKVSNVPELLQFTQLFDPLPDT